jgi:hypothetical protein
MVQNKFFFLMASTNEAMEPMTGKTMSACLTQSEGRHDSCKEDTVAIMTPVLTAYTVSKTWKIPRIKGSKLP